RTPGCARSGSSGLRFSSAALRRRITAELRTYGPWGAVHSAPMGPPHYPASPAADLSAAEATAGRAERRRAGVHRRRAPAERGADGGVTDHVDRLAHHALRG